MTHLPRFQIIVIIAVLLVTTSFATLPSTGLAIQPVEAAGFRQVAQGNSTEEPTSNNPTDTPTNVPTDAPTDVPTQNPTDVPSDTPTDVPTQNPTDVPTDTPTDVASQTLTNVPGNTPSDTPSQNPTATPTNQSTESANSSPASTGEATSVVTPAPTNVSTTATVTPETTETDLTATVTPVTTDEATAEVTVEATDEASAAEIDVVMVCKDTGLEFQITNNGDDMKRPMTYVLTLDSTVAQANSGAAQATATVEATPQFLLHTGETLNLEGGFGRPSLALSTATYQPDTDNPCNPPVPPLITVTMDCALDTGVTFTISNSGGPMIAEQGYTIAESDGSTITGTILLATDDKMTVSGGYGQPTLTTGELSSTPETACDAPATITGVAWFDANGDGTHDADETPIAGATVTLTDTTTGAYQTTVTVSDGSYGFKMLLVANYTITVDTSAVSGDYVPSSPTDGTATINAESGGAYTADFGFTANPTASISGTVWLETKNFGIHDPDEPGIPGAMVDLIDASGNVVATAAVNGATGSYEFTKVLAGSYTIRIDQSTLFTPNGVTYNSDSKRDYETPITLTSGQSLTGIDFGIVGTF